MEENQSFSVMAFWVKETGKSLSVSGIESPIGRFSNHVMPKICRIMASAYYRWFTNNSFHEGIKLRSWKS